jgi:hypothetical protein
LNKKLSLKPYTPRVNVMFSKCMVNATVSLFLGIPTDILTTKLLYVLNEWIVCGMNGREEERV